MPVLQVLFPLPLVFSPYFKIRMDPTTFFESVNPLTSVVVPVGEVFDASSVREAVEFFAVVDIFFLGYGGIGLG